jgi:hypothetical protein
MLLSSCWFPLKELGGDFFDALSERATDTSERPDGGAVRAGQEGSQPSVIEVEVMLDRLRGAGEIGAGADTGWRRRGLALASEMPQGPYGQSLASRPPEQVHPGLLIRARCYFEVRWRQGSQRLGADPAPDGWPVAGGEPCRLCRELCAEVEILRDTVDRLAVHRSAVADRISEV